MHFYKKHPIVRKALEDINSQIPHNAIGIRGRLYSISSLNDKNVFNHPGGNALIKINEGTDITNLFETHHLNITLAEQYLQKLPHIGFYEQYVKYDFTMYDKLRKIVFNNFNTRKSRKMNNFTKYSLYSYVVLTLFFHYLLLCESKYSLKYIILCILSSICNTICGSFGHNGVHNLSLSSLLLDWNGLSSIEWLLEHAHSHHMYTNTEYDHDAISLRPFLNWIPSNNSSFFAEKGKHLIYLIGELVVAIQGNLVHRCRWKLLFKKEYPMFLRLSPFVFISRILSHIIYQGFKFGSITLVICLMIASYYFSYLAHLNHGYSESNESNESNDFVLEQLKHTNDINIDSKLSHLFLMLDRQTIHHLFPSIDHCHLKKVKEILIKYIQETENSKISINSDSLIELNNKVNQTLNDLSKKINKKEN